MNATIKSMQLYPRPERIFDDLASLGYGPDAPVPLQVLNRFDQLHYHGVEALDAAISTCAMTSADRVLEVGSGWGGCARYIAQTSGAQVTAVELQADYDRVARELTARSGLAGGITHVNADFLELDLAPGEFSIAVSWLALFHIPRRADYLAKIHASLRPEGQFFAEDLYLISPPSAEEIEDFNAHLFPNSLIPLPEYRATLDAAGFGVTMFEDMTEDWTVFTRDRLAVFRDNRAQYIAVHGQVGYDTIEVFYAKMAGYFQRGMVGGLRVAARRAG